MNNRERIINTVLCKKVDRLPYLCDFGPWEETLNRWSTEGMPYKNQWKEHLDLDKGVFKLPVNLGFFPEFKQEVIEVQGDYNIVQDRFGVISKIQRNVSSIPHYLSFPVKDMNDWKKLKEQRLNPKDKGRFPGNFDEIAKECNEGDYVVRIGKYPFGLFGTIRELMGVEEFLVAFYEDPELIHDMMDYLTDFWIELYEIAVQKVKIDWIHIWEDMSGKTGSMISPALVKEFMLPNYKKITNFAKLHGIPIISLDTDGNCSELVPLFIEAGINFIFPFEVNAGSDINEYRRQYPKLGMMGGIDKMELAKGHDAIDDELERVRSVFEKSGYIPMLDHGIPPEVSWENFNYYMTRLKQIIFELENTY